jgi:hypothetical protein
VRRTSRRLAVIAATVGVLGAAGPVAGAHAASRTRSASAPAVASGSAAANLPLLALPPVAMRFVPPAVGPISVAIGATIIGGKVIDPGLNVTSPGVSLPPIAFDAVPDPGPPYGSIASA